MPKSTFLLGLLFAAAILMPFAGLGSQAIPQGIYADRILVEKSKRRLILFAGEQVLKEYEIALGENAYGPKEREGDKKTPEGHYIIDSRKADSDYHLALRISYPNADDIRRARKMGVPPGNNIMIHGIGSGLGWLGGHHRALDWTQGCIAVTNAEIEEIWRVVPDGTPIEIRP
jgi:murein L,D-transpeptidase YafK